MAAKKETRAPGRQAARGAAIKAAALNGGALRAAAEEYFAACDATRERVVLKNGEVTYHQVPYTMAGLCAHLGLPRVVLEAARGGEGSPRREESDETKKAPRKSAGCSKGEEEAQAALCWAAARVEQYMVERALLGELNAGVAAMLLNDWGYGCGRNGRDNRGRGDSGEDSAGRGALTVVLEDPEGLSR